MVRSPWIPLVVVGCAVLGGFLLFSHPTSRERPTPDAPLEPQHARLDEGSTPSRPEAPVHDTPEGGDRVRLLVHVRGPAEAMRGQIRFELRSAPDRFYDLLGPVHPFTRLDDATIAVEDVAPDSQWVTGATSATGSHVADAYVRIADDGRSTQEVTLHLVPAAVIEGRVISPTGDPVAGAVVRAWGAAVHPRSVHTEPDGRFVMRDAPADARIGAHAAELAPAYQTVGGLEPGGRVSVELQLGRPWEVAGTAVDDRGVPLTGTFMMCDEGEARYVKMDAAGGFVFRELGRGEGNLVAEWIPSGHLFARTCLDPSDFPSEGGRVDLGTVRFTTYYRQEVSVVDLDGRALPAVRVQTVSRRPEVDTTDRRGRASLWLTEGSHTLRLWGLDTKDAVAVEVGSRRTLPPVTLVAVETSVLRCRVSYAGVDRPPLDRLEWRVSEGEWEWRRGGIALDGSFSIAVPADRQEVSIEVGWDERRPTIGPDDSFRVLTSSRVTALGRPVELTIRPEDAMGVHVRVVEKDGETPVARYRLELGPKAADWETVGLLAAGGIHTSFPHDPGQMRIRVVTPEGRTGDSGTFTLAGDRWPTVTIRITEKQ